MHGWVVTVTWGGHAPRCTPCTPSKHPVPRRLIELHSPDSRNTLILRCKDTATAHSWFTALHANITALLPQVLAELNATLGGGAGGREVKHIAWLAEQVRGCPGDTVPVLAPCGGALTPPTRPGAAAAPHPDPVSTRRAWTAGGSSGGRC